MENEIDWEKYFDRIWCINYIPYANRKTAIEKEFNRVGISKHRNFMWEHTFDSPFYNVGFNIIKNNPNIGRLHSVTELKCWAAHYSCIKKSIAFGDDRILIIEDDSRFLKDMNMIKDMLDGFPTDYDIVLLDRSVNVSKEEYESYKSRKINDLYSEYENLDSCGCYSLSKNAMNKISYAYEHFIMPADNYTSKIRIEGLKKAFSLKSMSCQATYEKSMSVSNAGINTIHRVYANSDIIYDDYNMNDGKEYDYGSFIN